MADGTRILLIDDNAEARHELEIILQFLGEFIVPVSTTDWQQAAGDSGKSEYACDIALIGNCDSIELPELMQALYDWDAGVPFVLIGEVRLPQDLDPVLRSQVIASLTPPLGYQPLLDALHKAKVFHEHYNRLRDFAGVRDYNMFRSLVGNSQAVERVRHMMGQVANSEVSVLITGESGTGKEVVARNLHLNSSRADKPFIPINCGAIPRELLESELFGHEKGAFTGAVSSRAGRFELADGGTLFLDEIGDMPLNMQVKLLRVLQERSFERVGGVKTLQTNVRILAATHKNLEDMIEQGEFRQDLYYRINVFPIEMPPLRERSEDIPLLINELISVLEAEGRGSVRFNSSAIASLSRYHWPGNVRELANLIERMAIMYPHGIVGISDLPAKLQPAAIRESIISAREAFVNPKDSMAMHAAEGDAILPLNGLDLKAYLANLEKDLIEKALDDSDGVVSKAADRLHIRRTTLVEKMRKYSLQKKQSAQDDMSEEKGDESDDDDSGQAAAG